MNEQPPNNQNEWDLTSLGAGEYLPTNERRSADWVLFRVALFLILGAGLTTILWDYLSF